MSLTRKDEYDWFLIRNYYPQILGSKLPSIWIKRGFWFGNAVFYKTWCTYPFSAKLKKLKFRCKMKLLWHRAATASKCVPKGSLTLRTVLLTHFETQNGDFSKIWEEIWQQYVKKRQKSCLFKNFHVFRRILSELNKALKSGKILFSYFY